MRFLPSTPNPLVWPILLCAAAATYAAGVHLGFSPPGKDILHVVYFTAALLTAASVSHFVLKMPAASEPLALCAFWCGMAIILLPATYIAAAFNMPLMDETFSALDTAVGFNWRALPYRSRRRSPRDRGQPQHCR